MTAWFVGAVLAGYARETDVPLQSGHFLPVAAPSAALTCPQSLHSLDGIGHCIGVKPLGAAVFGGSRADVFVQCTAQMKPPQGNAFMYRYPFKSFDPTTGAPVFGAPVILETTGVFPSPKSNLSLTTLNPKTVWGSQDGQSVTLITTGSHLTVMFDDRSGASCRVYIGLYAPLHASGRWPIVAKPHVNALHCSGKLVAGVRGRVADFSWRLDGLWNDKHRVKHPVPSARQCPHRVARSNVRAVCRGRNL